ncbi:HAMP domain-containing histidine kinase [Paenibacillus sp. P25]|nr:HAMP domain-containing histidine kinase [Paenibacillus sp. P25]
MKKVKMVLGVAGVLCWLISIWTVSYAAIAFVAEGLSQKSVWQDMLANGRSMDAPSLESADRSLQRLALLRQEKLVLVGPEGGRQGYGAGADEFMRRLAPDAVREVLAGGVWTQYSRALPWKGGDAVTGQQILIGGKAYALFTQAATPPLLTHYDRYLYTSPLAMVVLFLWGTLFGKRHAHIQIFKNVIDAMRRIAKGDFQVSLEKGKQAEGVFGELVDSINHMAGELNQMEKLRQEFISNVSHEIQSPLTSINGFVRALQQEGLTEEERTRYLSIIETESARLSKISDNLLKLTSLESNHHPFEPQRYRLDKRLRRIILACEPQWDEKGLEMEIDLEETELTADEDLLSQVWINLLHNAIKFTPQGGRIGIHLQRSGEAAEVRLSDTGIGISAEDLPHIFERFFKADVSRERSKGGDGLGLSIVKKIVELHHGTIRAESTPGKGPCLP